MSENIIYLDSNQVFRIFERESRRLFPVFSAAALQNGWRLAVSDVNLFETVQGLRLGASLDAVRNGLRLLESMDPLWVFDIQNTELRVALSQYKNGEKFTGIDPYLNWSELLVAVSDDASIFDPMEFVGLPFPDVILSLHERGRIIGNERFWSEELAKANAAFCEMIRGKNRYKALKNSFIETVIHTCSKWWSDVSILSRFAEQLWDSPGVCPGFRLTFEVTVSLLGDNQASWTVNRFYDQHHLSVIPYVKHFVGLDRGQRHAITQFDVRLGNNAGINYGSRCYRNIEEILDATFKATTS